MNEFLTIVANCALTIRLVPTICDQNKMVLSEGI